MNDTLTKVLLFVILAFAFGLVGQKIARAESSTHHSEVVPVYLFNGSVVDQVINDIPNNIDVLYCVMSPSEMTCYHMEDGVAGSRTFQLIMEEV